MAGASKTGVRRRIAFDPEVYVALDRLARDRMATLQELADEAFRDLLKKHRRPVTLKEMLRESVAPRERSPSGAQVGLVSAAFCCCQKSRPKWLWP
jgi:Antitoxin-like ribbon-helix-helix